MSIQHDFDSSLSGSQTTTFTAIDASGNQSSCTSEIHIADLFPAQDLQVLSGVLNEDGQTSIELGWSPIESMDVTDLKLERATIGGEDWTEITTLSFEQYRTSLSLAPGTAWQVRLTSMGDGMEGASSEPIAVYSIQEAGYDVRDVTVPRIPFPTTLYGVVRAPTNLTGAPAPVICCSMAITAIAVKVQIPWMTTAAPIRTTSAHGRVGSPHPMPGDGLQAKHSPHKATSRPALAEMR